MPSRRWSVHRSVLPAGPLVSTTALSTLHFGLDVWEQDVPSPAGWPLPGSPPCLFSSRTYLADLLQYSTDTTPREFCKITLTPNQELTASPFPPQLKNYAQRRVPIQRRMPKILVFIYRSPCQRSLHDQLIPLLAPDSLLKCTKNVLQIPLRATGSLVRLSEAQNHSYQELLYCSCILLSQVELYEVGSDVTAFLTQPFLHTAPCYLKLPRTLLWSSRHP
ncbi:uncharacterized protein RBU33_018192 [Hipposideros larvatus]